MANEYDRILRENISEIFIPLVERQLGVEIAKSRVLPTKFTGTFEREVDHLFDVHTKSGKHFLIHFEFQTNNSPKMLRRMLLYHGHIYFKYGLPIEHFVIYLGKSPARMQDQMEPEAVFEGYHLVSIRRQRLADLLSSQVPEEVVLGILSNYGNLEVDEVVRQIVHRLKEISADPESLHISLKQLGILSRIVKLDSKVINELKNMPLDIDFKGHVLYKEGEAEGLAKGKAEGKAEGIAEGKAEGIAEGKAEGEVEGMRKVVLQLLREGVLDLSHAARTLGVTESEVLAMAKNADQ